MNDQRILYFFKLIKWLLKAVFVIFGIIPFTSCNSGYNEKNGKVMFDGKEITDESFIILNDEFGKDSATVYYKSKSIENADISSFEALDANYAKDKNKAYYCDEFREGQNYYLTKKQTVLEIELAISSSFVSVGNGYARDSAHAFFLGNAFSVKDIASFKPLNSNFCKDDIQAYLDCKPIVGSDGKSFEVLNEFFAKDKNRVYFCQSAGPGKQQVTVMPCDAVSFKVLGNGYSKDLHNVYFEANRLVDADAATFELYKENESIQAEFYYAKDKASIFIEGKKISGADVGSFRILKFGYGADLNHVFYKHTLVKDASVDSFKTYEHGYGDEDAEDASFKYLNGEKVFEH